MTKREYAIPTTELADSAASEVIDVLARAGLLESLTNEQVTELDELIGQTITCVYADNFGRN